MKQLTQERLKELLEYDSGTGELAWKGYKNNRTAGYIDNGYRRIEILEKTHQVKTIAWLYMYGVMVKPSDILFINGDRLDVSISNLALQVKDTEYISQKRLKQLVSYNRETGNFKKNPAHPRYHTTRQNLESESDGYKYIGIDGKVYGSHRLAWLYCYGYMPEHLVDHKNGNGNDNRICNLREAGKICNAQNAKIRVNNTSGFNGVSYRADRKVWKSTAMIKGKTINLGSFGCVISAALARCEFEKCCPDWACNYQGVNFVKLRKLGYSI